VRPPELRPAALRNVLAIAGFDPSGGAGVLADVKTISACGAYGLGVLTAVTAQNTVAMRAVAPVDPELVAAQLDSLLEDVRLDAVKIGMLGSAEVAGVVADRLARAGGVPVVLDPVLAASVGGSLAGPGVREVILARLAPLCALITPNLDEAAALAGFELADEPAIERAGMEILRCGAPAVLIKGGHGEGPVAVDRLFLADGRRRDFAGPRLPARSTHGTGCALASAIAAHLARGAALEDAIVEAKAFVAGAIDNGPRLSVGAGRGPLHHFWNRA
jgi:hydroxymethylpyrimidine kinase/phosphomethylpyrimidine kinase